MFGKKKEENPENLIKVLKTYTEPSKTIQKWLNGKKKGEHNIDYDIEPVDIMSQRYIYIDLIRLDIHSEMDPPQVACHIPSDTPAEYIKSWRKGLGRFINRDVRKRQTEGKYFILSYTDIDMVRRHALIRLFSEEELSDEEQVKEFERYKLINLTFPYQILSGLTDSDTVLIPENSKACILKIFRDGMGLSYKTPVNKNDEVFFDEWNNQILPLESKEKPTPTAVSKPQPIPTESLFD